MSRRRRNSHTRFSLFAFQDIITCVMGIMLLLTLIMCLRITTEIGSAKAMSVDQTLDKMAEQAAALKTEVEQLQQATGRQQELLESGALDDPTLLRERVQSMQTEKQLAADEIRDLWREQTTVQSTLDSIRQTAASRAPQVTQTNATQVENQQLSESLDELKRGDRVIYNTHDSTSATCWLVELHDLTTIRAAEQGKSQRPLTFASRSALQVWMKQRHRAGAVFLLIVKPKAADLLEPLSEALRDSNVAFGFDLLPQDKVAVDPVTGAAAL